MPVTIKKSQFKYKDPSTGNYVGVDGFAERTTAEMVLDVSTAGQTKLNAINAAGTTNLNAINTRATEVQASLPTSGEMEDMVSVPFNQATAYPAGKYVIQTVNGVNKLYMLPDGHEAGVAWENTTVQGPYNLGDKVSDLQAELTEDVKELQITFAPPYSSDDVYDTGSYVTKDGGLYYCKAGNIIPEEWESSRWEGVSVGDGIAIIDNDRTENMLAEAFIGKKIELEILKLANVTSAKAYINVGNYTDDRQIPSNSIALCFSGGNARDIGKRLKECLPEGMNTYGTLPIPVDGENVYIRRAVSDDCSLSVYITKSANYDETVEETIKDRIVSYVRSLDIGDGLYDVDLYHALQNVAGEYCTFNGFVIVCQARSNVFYIPTQYHRVTLTKEHIHIYEGMY